MKRNILSLLLVILAASFQVSAQNFLTQVKPKDSRLWGYANQKGELVIPARFEKCYPFSSAGLAPIYDTRERQYYFINVKGEKLTTEVTSFKLQDGFADVESFTNGLIQVKIGEKWGYLDKGGKIGIPAKYESTTSFDDGLAIAKVSGNYVVIDTKGTEKTVVGTGITEIRQFSEKLAPFRGADRKYGFIGADGKIAIPGQFESVGYFKNGLAWAKTPERLLGYINPKGDWVIQPQFDAGHDFDAESGLARVKKGPKWMYVNKSGVTSEVSISETFGDFSEGLAEGKIREKRGYYNAKGDWVIEPKFEGTRNFKNGFAAAREGGKWGMINKQGKWVIEPVFEGIKDMESIR